MIYKILYQFLYGLSRLWNYIVISLSLFLLWIAWDFTGRNRDLVDDPKKHLKFLREIIG